MVLLIVTRTPFAVCYRFDTKAFDDAMRGGPEEVSLWERNKAHTPSFFLDIALEEASPKKLELDLDSRCVHPESTFRQGRLEHVSDVGKF